MVLAENWINHLWLDQSWYNFTSSEWGGLLVKGVFFIAVVWLGKRVQRKVHAHLECHIEGCTRIGHPVHGTSFRACKPHHPHLNEAGHSVSEVHFAAEDGHNVRIGRYGAEHRDNP